MELHRVLVIARVGKVYRSLAIVVHDWVDGISTLKQCFMLLNIFRNPENAHAISQELHFAEEYFHDYNNNIPRQSQLFHWQKSGGGHPFPFIATCLWLGASYESFTHETTGIKKESFGKDYERGWRDEGITVIDISDVKNVKYCFVSYRGTRSFQPVLEPVAAWKYLSSCYEPGDEAVEKDKFLPDYLEKQPLVTLHTLMETWPRGDWKTEESPVPVENIPENIPPTQVEGLVEKTISTLIDAVVSDDNLDVGFIENNLPSGPTIKSAVSLALLKAAEHIGLSSSCVLLLAIAYEDEEYLDWHAFVNMKPEVLKAALAAPQLQNAKEINLSGTLCMENPKEMWDALSILPSLEKVIAFNSPLYPERKRGMEIIWAAVDAKPATMTLPKLELSDPYVRPWAVEKRLPRLKASNILHPAFPVLQLLVAHRSAEMPYEFFPVADSLLTPARFVNGLFNYIRMMNKKNMNKRNRLLLTNSGPIVSISMAMGSSKIVDATTSEIAAPPTEVCHFADQLADLPPTSTGNYGDMRDLVAGYWTVLLARKGVLEIGGRLEADEDDMGFQYAFVRTKVDIPVRSRKDPEYRRVTPEDVDVLNLHDFLGEYGIGSQGLKKAIEDTKHAAYGDSSTGSDGKEFLTCLSKEEACGVLAEFMARPPQRRR